MPSSRWLFAALFMVAPVLAAASPARTPPASPKASPTPRRDVAPADRYFGMMKMSPLGIRGRIGFLARNYTWRTMTDDQLVHDAQLIQNALDDWRVKFPSDPWLAPTAFHLAQLYGEIQSNDARKQALEMLRYTSRYWPNSNYGHLSRIRLQQGFPPLHDELPMRPTPAPSPSPTPQESPTPTPSPAPTETPTASPTPSPSPTPTPEPRRRRRSRATPAPSPSPTPSPSPSPAPSSSPAPAASLTP